MHSEKVTLAGYNGCAMMVAEGTAPAGRLKKTWQNCVSFEDLCLLGLNTLDAQDRVRWRSEIRRQPNPASSGETSFKR